jgi:hypothetical protein
MRAYTLTHVGDAVLLRDLGALVAQDRITTAALLAHIAEADARRLYLQNGHPSMFAYCVDELRLSEGGAYKRIQAARAARAHPVIFAAVADGRLHLTAVRLLAPYLTPENADELLAAATHRRRPEIEQLLAQRFPPLRAPVPTVRAIPSESIRKRVLGPVASPTPSLLDPSESPLPPAPERYSVHVAIDRDTHDKLRYAQELLSHCVPSGDLAQVLDRALDALIGQLEQQKFAATTKPRPQQGQSPRKRHVSASVRAERTFASEFMKRKRRSVRRMLSKSTRETCWPVFAVLDSARRRRVVPQSPRRPFMTLRSKNGCAPP